MRQPGESMRIEHEPVTVAEIARRLHYSHHTVTDWTHREDFFPPFPPPRWQRQPHALFDWPIVLAWYERTHSSLNRSVGVLAPLYAARVL